MTIATNASYKAKVEIAREKRNGRTNLNVHGHERFARKENRTAGDGMNRSAFI